jgi:thiosulfate dehydrogenase (quinone) large subunit
MFKDMDRNSSQENILMQNRTTRYLLSAIQAIIGWEWLMSGGNKLLSGTFPQGLANALNKGIKHNPNNWYIAFLQQTVQPHSIFYGYLIEWTEVTVGVILLSGSLILLGQPRVAGESQHRLAVAFSIAVAIAAAVAAVMAVNFHFWMGGWVIPTFNPAAPYSEGIDLDGLLPALSLVIIIANIALIQEMTGGSLLKRFARFAHVSKAPALAQMEREQVS